MNTIHFNTRNLVSEIQIIKFNVNIETETENCLLMYPSHTKTPSHLKRSNIVAFNA